MIVILVVVAAVVIWQLAVWFSEIRYKNVQSRAAVEYSRSVNKPLLVAGGPWGGRPLRRRLKMPAHVMGDVSIDIIAGAVMGHPNGIVATVTKLPFPDKTFGAALASHLLEHLYTTAEAKNALKELNRVAEKVYIAYPTRQSFAAWLIPDHRLWVWQKGETVYLRQRRAVGKQIEEHYNLTDGREN